MFAVIKTGGKQYRVAANDVLSIERLEGDAGASVTFAQVLMIGGDTPTVGAPLVEGACVSAEIVSQGRGAKVIAFKKRRRQNSRRKRGHRQQLTVVRIVDISAPGLSSGAAKPARAKKKSPEGAGAPEQTASA